MTSGSLWFLIIGTLLIFMALAGSVVKRLPLSMAMLYLFIGVALGPMGAGLFRVDI
jgi:NhaP-type Na+/H+ or K+/H+ antiporter